MISFKDYLTELQKEEHRDTGHVKAFNVKEEAEQILEYGDTAKGQKMLAKVQKRATDRLIKADDKNRLEPDVAKRDLNTVRKNAATAQRAYDRMEEEVEQIDELAPATLSSYIGKRQSSPTRTKAAVDAISQRFSGHKGPTKLDRINHGLRRAREKYDAEREKQTAMNPKKPPPAPPRKTGFRSGAEDDTYGT